MSEIFGCSAEWVIFGKWNSLNLHVLKKTIQKTVDNGKSSRLAHRISTQVKQKHKVLQSCVCVCVCEPSSQQRSTHRVTEFPETNFLIANGLNVDGAQSTSWFFDPWNRFLRKIYIYLTLKNVKMFFWSLLLCFCHSDLDSSTICPSIVSSF